MTNIIHFKRHPASVSEITLKIELDVTDDGAVWYRTECCGRVSDWVKIEEEDDES